MQTVAQVIRTYFYIRRSRDPDRRSQIITVDPRHKLKVPGLLAKTGVAVAVEEKSHAENKRRAIAIVKELLSSGPPELAPYLTFFNAQSKQDDLADAFLQAAAWVLERSK